MAEQERKGLDLEQQRAARAWEKVKDCGKAYTNLAKSAPALIMNNGLMQTLAYYESKAKGDDHHRLLSDHICSWLEERGFSTKKGNFLFKNVMEYLHGSSSQDYRRATEESLSFLRWIRQFASALTSKE